MTNKKITDAQRWELDFNNALQMYLNQKKETRRVLNLWGETLERWRASIFIDLVAGLGMLVGGLLLGILIGMEI